MAAAFLTFGILVFSIGCAIACKPPIELYQFFAWLGLEGSYLYKQSFFEFVGYILVGTGIGIIFESRLITTGEKITESKQ